MQKAFFHEEHEVHEGKRAQEIFFVFLRALRGFVVLQ